MPPTARREVSFLPGDGALLLGEGPRLLGPDPVERSPVAQRGLLIGPATRWQPEALGNNLATDRRVLLGEERRREVRLGGGQAQAKTESADLAREWFEESNPLVREAGAHALLWFDPTQNDARHHLASLLPEGLASSNAFFGLASVMTIIEDLARGGLDADGVLQAVLSSRPQRILR
jgi:hypothetical protein